MDTSEKDESTRRGETLEELETATYEVSHDLRAPLRAIISFSQILVEDHASGLDAQGKDYLNRIHVASLRMDQMIQDILLFSHPSRSRPTLAPVNVLGLIAEAREHFPSLLITFADLSDGTSIPLVLARESALFQCLSNILGNACRFVTAGVQPNVRISSRVMEGGRIRISFQDNGIGIALENQVRIFHLFQRVDTEREGTGIGLATVKRSIEKMGGTVGVESELGNGSTFWLELAAGN